MPPVENEPRVFARLVGVETEYVLRFQPCHQDQPRPSNRTFFQRMLSHLRRKVPVAEAIVGEDSWFLVNGGSLKFEHLPFYRLMSASGFVEGATPECRGPNQLLRYQRAQDVLFSQHAAASGAPDGDVTLLKSSHDGQGHLFGSHENYEATIGTGVDLLIWRVTLFLALPILFFLLVAADILALTLVGILSLFWLIRREFNERASESFYSNCVAWTIRLCRTPVQLFVAILFRQVAFHRLQQRFIPFLVTRTIISGSGMVCPDGQFVLSPRATSLHSICGMSAAAWRSVFYFCQVLKAFNDPSTTASLFRRRQRLQLTIADSNMAQFAEYLKIGTTLLVLDAIEAGELDDVPQLKRPLNSLREISADPMLQVQLPLVQGGNATALQIQRSYWSACRRFVDRHAPENSEAKDVIRHWEQALDSLEHHPEQLIGKLDWITKKHLIDSAGPDMSVEEKRKLDLRYHELSQEGYYLRLEAAGTAPTVVDPEEVLQSITSPPEATPASLRGRYIRDYAHSPYQIKASWSAVQIPGKRGPRVIRLSSD